MALGRRGGRPQPPVRGRARVRLADGDRPGDSAAASELPARLLRVLDRAVRERRPAGTDRRARARRRAQPAALQRRAMWPTLLGTVFAHRVFDLVAVICLILYVALTAHIPGLGGDEPDRRRRRRGRALHDRRAERALPPHADLEAGSARFARSFGWRATGSASCDGPPRQRSRVCFQILGWGWQLVAVCTTMRAFGIHEPLPAAALVLVLMNVATIFPLWPGNVGLVQAAVALPLVPLLRRRQGERDRVRLRAAGDRGVRRRRRRPDLSRARGAVVRDAEGDAGRVAGRRAGGGEVEAIESDAERRRSRARLASRAFSPRARQPRRSPRGCGAGARRRAARRRRR